MKSSYYYPHTSHLAPHTSHLTPHTSHHTYLRLRSRNDTPSRSTTTCKHHPLRRTPIHPVRDRNMVSACGRKPTCLARLMQLPSCLFIVSGPSMAFASVTEYTSLMGCRYVLRIFDGMASELRLGCREPDIRVVAAIACRSHPPP